MTSFKNILYILVFGATFSASAQLFVKPSGPVGSEVPSYVFVDDTFIYVEQDVELEINPNPLEESSIILRNEAQLLQGNGDGSTTTSEQNKGTGDISLFQEGTVNMWDYNFWASPVGLSFDGSGSAAADGNGVFAVRALGAASFFDTNSVLFYPASLTESQVPLLVGGFDSTVEDGGPLRIATYWLWSYNSGVGYAAWDHIDDTGTLSAGNGFTMKGVNGIDNTDAGDGIANNSGSGQRYDFRGRPNNGTINVSIGADELALVGNPYPSALDLDYFLLQNSDDGSSSMDITDRPDGVDIISVPRNDVTTGIALFWDSDPSIMSHYLEDYQGGYGTYSPLLSTANPGIYVNATYYTYDETGSQTGTAPGTSTSYGRRFAPIGQGFMMQGSNTGGTIQFENNHRVYLKETPGSSDFRTNETADEPIPAIGVVTYYPDVRNMGEAMTQLKIGININDTYSRQLGIALLDAATSGYDVAGDAQIGGLPTDVSFEVEGEKGYVINATFPDESQVLPITLDAETAAEYRFFAHETKNFAYEGVYLLDKETQTYYDIYTESVLIQLEAGEHSDRFAIVFKKEQDDAVNSDNETLSTDDITLETGILESFNVIQNNTSRQLEIYNPLSISLDKMSLFDMAGKLVISEDQLGTQSIYTFPTANLSSGIYIAQFVTDEGLTKARKISVTN